MLEEDREDLESRWMSVPLTDEERHTISASSRARGLRVDVGSMCEDTDLHPISARPLFVARLEDWDTRYHVCADSLRVHLAAMIDSLIRLRDAVNSVDGTEIEIYTYASAIGEDAATPPQVGDAREVCGSKYKVAQVGLNANDFASGWITLRLERVDTGE